MKKLITTVLAVSLGFGLGSVSTSLVDGEGALRSAAAASPSEKAQARSAWVKGKRLLAQKQFEQAIEQLQTAVDLNPDPRYQLDLARALADSGSMKDALALLTEVQESDSGPHGKAAAKLSKEIEQRMPTITPLVSEGVDAEVHIDGERVEASQPTRVDPGGHTLTLEQDGDVVAKKSVVVKEREQKKVPLNGGAKIAKAESDDEDDKPKKKKKDGSGGVWWPAGVSYGVGGAALGAGAILGFMAFDATNQLEPYCSSNGSCPIDKTDELDTARLYGNLSTAGFVVGGVGAAAGLVFTFTHGLSGGDDSKESDSATLTPYVGPLSAGLVGTF